MNILLYYLLQVYSFAFYFVFKPPGNAFIVEFEVRVQFNLKNIQ